VTKVDDDENSCPILSDEQLINIAHSQGFEVIDVPNANSMQIGGGHYKRKALEPWDHTVLNDLDTFQHEICAYVVRHKEKNGIQDLEKALHWLQKYIEVEKLRAEMGPVEMKAKLLEDALAKLVKR
jgi:hypothetical protein